MKKVILIATPIVAIIAIWWFFGRGDGGAQEIEYRYAKVEKGTVSRSISATGQLVALTIVDVKSKAGGKIVKLAVEEGSVVKKGDLIAEIDPSDTKAVYQQADADLKSAQARAAQAVDTLKLTKATNQTSVADAAAALDVAQSRLKAMQIQHARQPLLSRSQLNSAQAAYDSQLQALSKYQQVTAPQLRRDAAGTLASSQAAYNAAKAALSRQRDLLAEGYVSQATVDTAQANFQSAEAQYNLAKQRNETIGAEIETSLKAQQLAVAQALASLNQAKANQTDVRISDQDLAQARIAVSQSAIALQKAKDNLTNNAIRARDIDAAVASTTRSRVSVDNAKVQLDSTTVVAPRDGVVTLKYLEEGTIIPPGTSTFAQGTSLVQLSDVTELYVECQVDEADIASVRLGQTVHIVTEAFPGRPFDGEVSRISPAAVTTNNVTAVKVRVHVLPGAKVRILPGMNATCEFITLEKKDVLVVPSQAVQNEDGKSVVRVPNPNDPKKPLTVPVEVGETGNDGIEIVSGLKEGDEVVVGEINIGELRAIQDKMNEAQQGGGLAGGNGMRMPTRGGNTKGGSGGASKGGGGAPKGGGGAAKGGG